MRLWRQVSVRYRVLRRRRSFRWAFDLAFVALIFSIAGLWQARSVVRGPAPAFSVSQLGRGEVVSDASLKGHPTVIAFWAPWCGVCKTETANVANAANWAGNRARVLSMATSYESLDEVNQFVRDYGVTYPVLLDANGQVAPSFGVRAYPTLVFLNEDGVIKHATVGYTTTLGILLRLWF